MKQKIRHVECGSSTQQ